MKHWMKLLGFRWRDSPVYQLLLYSRQTGRIISDTSFVLFYKKTFWRETWPVIAAAEKLHCGKVMVV